MLISGGYDYYLYSLSSGGVSGRWCLSQPGVCVCACIVVVGGRGPLEPSLKSGGMERRHSREKQHPRQRHFSFGESRANWYTKNAGCVE